MNTIAVGNALRLPLPDGCVQATITSPPYYHKRKYAGAQACPWPAVTYTPMAGCMPLAILAWHGALGQETDVAAFIGHLVLIFREVWRVTRRDGTLAINIGDTFASSGGAHDGRNDNQRGVGAAHVYRGSGDGQAIRCAPTAVPAKNLFGVPYRLAFALQADGWLLRNQWPWVKTAGLPESVTDRLTVGHEDWFLFAKSQNYYYDRDAARALAASYTRQGGSAPYLANGATTHGLGSDSLHQMAVAGHQRRTSDMWLDSARQAVIDLRAQADHIEQVLASNGAVFDNDGDVVAQLLNPRGTKVEHYATFATNLVDPLIELLSAARACPRCGMAWRRVSEAMSGPPPYRASNASQTVLRCGGESPGRTLAQVRTVATTGWQPACACGAAGLLTEVVLPEIATCESTSSFVLDPFMGTGTVPGAAERLGRRAVGLDLALSYAQMAHARLAAPLLDAPEDDVTGYKQPSLV